MLEFTLSFYLFRIQSIILNLLTIEGVLALTSNQYAHNGWCRFESCHPRHFRQTFYKNFIQRLKINTDHWTGQGWSKGQQKKDWSQYSKVGHFKKHLIKQKGHKCENCGLTEWQKQSIVLEVHHEDGDRTNNDFSNLKLLCCNCHALTHNWRNKNKNI